MESKDITALLLIKDWLDSKPELGEWERDRLGLWTRGFQLHDGQHLILLIDREKEDYSHEWYREPLPPLASPDFFDVLEQLIKDAKNGTH